jgi:hypothetical protein
VSSLANDLSEPDKVKVAYDVCFLACQFVFICTFPLESLFLFASLLATYGQRVCLHPAYLACPSNNLSTKAAMLFPVLENRRILR